MIIRFAIAVVLGAAVAFGLLFLMQALIATGHSALTETEDARVVDFVRVEREETVERKRDRRPDRPPNPDAPPPEAPQPSLDNAADSAEASQAVRVSEQAPVPVAEVAMEVSAGFGVSDGAADGDYLPIVKVAPVYPRRAVDLGIEGYVIVEFTVTKSGSVRDPVVIEYHPSKIFNKAAIEAALKFKYKPRIVNGEPIEVQGVLNKITFRLED